MATIEIDDNLHRQLLILFSALQAEVPALNMTTYANAALGAALEELLESSTIRTLCVERAAELGYSPEDWQEMADRVSGRIDRDIDRVQVQNESFGNRLRANILDTEEGIHHD